MSDYHFSSLSDYRDRLQWFDDNFLLSDIYSVSEDGSILLPQKIRDTIDSKNRLIEVLCFVEKDYHNTITCIHPNNTDLLRNLVDTDPTKWFFAEIDWTYRLHIPIDTLRLIRITKKAFFSAFGGFSWSIMDPKEEQLSYQAYVDALGSWLVSVPDKLLGDDTSKNK